MERRREIEERKRAERRVVEKELLKRTLAQQIETKEQQKKRELEEVQALRQHFEQEAVASAEYEKDKIKQRRMKNATVQGELAHQIEVNGVRRKLDVE